MLSVRGRNVEGQMVVDFAKRREKALVNTYFKKEDHRITYKVGERLHERTVSSPGGPVEQRLKTVMGY